MICTQFDATVSSGLRQRLCRRVPNSSQIGGGRWGGVFGGLHGLFTLAALFAVPLATSGCHSHAEASQQVEAQVDRSPEAGKQSKSGHPKACSLLSAQEVSAATKLNIVNATSDEDDELCNYTTADDGVSTVSVQVDWEGGKFAFQAGSKLMENAAGNTQFRTAVAGDRRRSLRARRQPPTAEPDQPRYAWTIAKPLQPHHRSADVPKERRVGDRNSQLHRQQIRSGETDGRKSRRPAMTARHPGDKHETCCVYISVLHRDNGCERAEQIVPGTERG